MSIVLHVGGAKCGSSALQSALTRRPRFDSALHGPMEYVYIDRDWQVRRVPDGHVSAAGYIQSAGFVPDHLPSDEDVRGMAARLNAIQRAGVTPVLSAEGWLNSKGFLGSTLLERIDTDIEILLWVRPQLEFLNSGWWQWGAWAPGIGIAAWCRKNLRRCQWGNRLRGWAQRHDLRYRVRLVAGDVVDDFCALYGVEGLEPGARNVGLDGDLLRFLQQRGDLKPDAHDNRVVLAAQRHLEGRDGGAPWVIPAALAEELVERSRLPNLALLEHLEPAQAQRMREDARWWDAAAYADRPVEPAGTVSLDSRAVAAIAADALRALAEVDAANVSLRRRLRERNQAAGTGAASDRRRLRDILRR